MTFLIATIAAAARWILGCVVGVVVGWVSPLLPGGAIWSVGGCLTFAASLVPSPLICGILFAALPLLFSLAAFCDRSQGRLWRKRVGAHRASAEQQELIGRIVSRFEEIDARVKLPSWCYVVDWPRPVAFVRGRALVVSTGLLECEGLSGVLAHELGHLVSFDGVLTAALCRLGLWGDPFAPPDDDRVVDESGWLAALVVETVRWTICVGGAQWVLRVTNWLWAPYWRSRERAADDYAASLGQAAILADHLEEVEKPCSRPQRYWFLNPFEHDPPDLRIERLRSHARGGG